MMKLGWFLLGAISLLLIQAVAAAIVLTQAHGWSAREQPTAIERWAARWLRGAALPAGAATQANPIAKTPEILADARAHWADHCAVCHANDGSGDTSMGKHLYPPAPDMRKPATQKLTDGELFYIIENGVRLTGMPAWGGSDRDAADSWKLVHFIRHLPDLSVQERKQMEKLNPKSPEELKEEEEEERFLNGESTNEPQHHQHH